MKEAKTIEQMWRYIYMTGVGDMMMGLSLISYFFILKGLEGRSFCLSTQDKPFADAEVSACHWSRIKQMAIEDPGECCQHLRTKVARQLRSLDPESCLVDAEQAFVRVQPRIIYPFIDAIDTLCEGCLSVQDAFEAVLLWAEGEGAFQHKAGQIMTPLHIAYLMADLVRPQAHERVVDVSCGSGNLLVATRQHMQRSHASPSWILDTGLVLSKKIGSCSSEPALLGFDFDSMMLPPCYAHLLLSGVDKPHIRCSDALGSVFNQRMMSQELGTIDVLLGNPPFGRYTDVSDLGATLRQMGTLGCELLFVELTLQLLRTGGRAVLLVPEGVVRNSSQAAIRLRKKLAQEHQLKAVISLPPGIFLPQANVKTSLLLFHKGGNSREDVLFYRVSTDGYTFNAKRQATPASNDLWDVRTQCAVVCGQEPPIPEMTDASWWAMYASDRRYPGTRYVLPSVEEVDVNPVLGNLVSPFRRITGFIEVEDSMERSWFVSMEEIEASGSYSLCADTYRENTATRQKRRHSR